MNKIQEKRINEWRKIHSWLASIRIKYNLTFSELLRFCDPTLPKTLIVYLYESSSGSLLSDHKDTGQYRLFEVSKDKMKKNEIPIGTQNDEIERYEDAFRHILIKPLGYGVSKISREILLSIDIINGTDETLVREDIRQAFEIDGLSFDNCILEFESWLR